MAEQENGAQLTPPFSFGEGDDRPEWMQWVAPGAITDLVAKLQRAHRNNTGLSFSSQQVRDLLEAGAVEIIMRAELEEMKQAARKVTLADQAKRSGRVQSK